MKQKYNIKIEYDGKYPCLCIGKLFVTIDEKRYEFPDYCLISGGSCGFTNDYEESFVEPGEWSIDSWPEDLPPIGTTCLAKLHTIGVNGVGWEHAEDLYEYQVLTYFNGFWGHKPLYGPINILRYKEVIAWIELPETEIIK